MTTAGHGAQTAYAVGAPPWAVVTAWATLRPVLLLATLMACVRRRRGARRALASSP